MDVLTVEVFMVERIMFSQINTNPELRVWSVGILHVICVHVGFLRIKHVPSTSQKPIDESKLISIGNVCVGDRMQGVFLG